MDGKRVQKETQPKINSDHGVPMVSP